MKTIKFKEDGVNSNRRLASFSPLCSSDISHHIREYEKAEYAKDDLEKLKEMGHDVEIVGHPYK